MSLTKRTRILIFTVFSIMVAARECFATPQIVASKQSETAPFSLAPLGTLPYKKLGVNAFVNDSRFGSIRKQFLEVKNTIKVRNVRMLFRWDDLVQPLPTSAPNFSFYDDIVRNIPSGVKAFVVITGVPSWMSNPTNWLNGNPRSTFVQRWVNVVVARYAKRRSIVGWQIWNEPNMESDSDNQLLGFVDEPANYVAMLSEAYDVIRDLAPQDKVIAAATTAINQNYPTTFDYNKDLKTAGIESVCDIWSMHYYGAQYERLLFLGISTFLQKIDKPIWVTESGSQGVTTQLEYGRRTWPLLVKTVPSIARIYIYQFTEDTASSVTYGLRNLSLEKPKSDLYLHLQSRK